MTFYSIKKMFPDWNEIKPGMWSAFTKIVKYKKNRTLEIGLYREPMENDEYAGTLTLQIFDNDDVIFCATCEEDAE